MRQAHLVLELILDSLEQVMGVAVNIADHIELLCRAKNV